MLPSWLDVRCDCFVWCFTLCECGCIDLFVMVLFVLFVQVVISVNVAELSFDFWLGLLLFIYVARFCLFVCCVHNVGVCLRLTRFEGLC